MTAVTDAVGDLRDKGCATTRGPNMLRSGKLAAAVILLTGASTLVPASARAQETETTVQSETVRLKAQAELERARADRDRASADRISALGLPSFEGKTTMGDGAGAMEATMLASHAVRAAAAMIARGVPKESKSIVVLAGDEALDFSSIGALGAEMSAIRHMLLRILKPSSTGGFAGAAAVISAATAAAGLFRSDTEVAALDTSALSNRVLASMVAAQLGTRAIIPSAAMGSVDAPTRTEAGSTRPARVAWDDMTLMERLNELVDIRRQVFDEMAEHKPKDPEKPTKEEQATLAPFTGALARFDTFFARVTTADDKGALAIVKTVRLEQIWRLKPHILRVYVDKVGGSRVTRKNIGTTLTLATPVKISGGLVASYSLTDPSTGQQIAFDLLSCRTTFTTLQAVQRGVWKNPMDNAQKAYCQGERGSSTTTILANAGS
ncbi:MAG TPA: hypothetical protein VGC35_09080 [Allosphingosinicella sp.]